MIFPSKILSQNSPKNPRAQKYSILTLKKSHLTPKLQINLLPGTLKIPAKKSYKNSLQKPTPTDRSFPSSHSPLISSK